jgi:hypothetical protein
MRGLGATTVLAAMVGLRPWALKRSPAPDEQVSWGRKKRPARAAETFQQ